MASNYEARSYTAKALEIVMECDIFLHSHSEKTACDIFDVPWKSTNGKAFTKQTLSIEGLRQLYEEIFDCNLDDNKIDTLNEVLYSFADEPFLPVIIYSAFLFSKASDSFYGSYKEKNAEDDIKTLKYVFEQFINKTYFFVRSKKEDFEKTNRYLQFFCDCLYAALYSSEVDVDEVNLFAQLKSDLQDDKAQDILNSASLPKFKETFIEKVSTSVSKTTLNRLNKIGNQEIEIDKANNLFYFNQNTHLIDWFLAVQHNTLNVLQLENMFFFKDIPFPYDQLTPAERTIFVQASMRVFNFKIQNMNSDLDAMGNRLFYKMEAMSDELVGKIKRFHAGYAKAFIVEDQKGKIAEEKALYDAIRDYYA